MGVVSNCSGEIMPVGSSIPAKYWRQHTREPVRFQQSIEKLAAERVTLCLELGPGQVLSSLLAQGPHGDGIKCLATLAEGEATPSCLARSLADVFVSGVNIDWESAYQARRPQVSLPHYPFQREQYRLENPVVDRLPVNDYTQSAMPSFDTAYPGLIRCLVPRSR